MSGPYLVGSTLSFSNLKGGHIYKIALSSNAGEKDGDRHLINKLIQKIKDNHNEKLVSLLIICASVVGATVSVFAYSDTDNSSYKSSIDELSQLGIINGFEDGTFKPQENVTRAQAATMFAAALGYYSDTKYKNIA